MFKRADVAGAIPRLHPPPRLPTGTEDWSKLQAIWRDPEQRRVCLERLGKATSGSCWPRCSRTPRPTNSICWRTWPMARLSREEGEDKAGLHERTWLGEAPHRRSTHGDPGAGGQVCPGRVAGNDPTPPCSGSARFREMGKRTRRAAPLDGDPQRFRATITELQRRLYAEAAWSGMYSRLMNVSELITAAEGKTLEFKRDLSPCCPS